MAGRILNLKNPTAVKTKYSQHFMPLNTFLRSGSDILLTDLVSNTHSEYIEALTEWDRNIRNAAAAHEIELAIHKHVPGPKIIAPVVDEPAKFSSKEGMTIEIWNQ